MLQSLREHVQGWIAGVIASILGLAFALWGVEYYLNNGPTQVTIAKVDGEEITQNQLDLAYNRARQAQQLQPADPAENAIFQKQIKAHALNGLIQQHVLTRAAHKAGYVISPVQVGAALQQMPGFQLNGQFSYELFQRTLLNLSYTPEVFSQEIATSALLQQVQRSLVESNFALIDDLNHRILLDDQKRDFGYMLISPTPFLATASVTDQAIADYYKTNSKKFTTPEQVSLQYLKLSTDDASKKIVMSDQELNQYYAENKTIFTTPQQWQVAHILLKVAENTDVKTQNAQAAKIKDIAAQLKSGKDFAKLAKKYSEDTTIASKGGILGWLTRAQQPELVQTVSSLQPGQISAPFQNKQGWHLVKLMAMKNAEMPSFAKIKPQVEKNLRQQKAEQWIAEQSDKLANLAYTHPDSLKPTADALNLPIQTTALFTRQGEKAGLLSNSKILTVAFSDNVLKQHNNSDVISIDDHTAIVVRVADYKPAVAKPLKEVRADIEKILKQQAAQKAATVLGEKIIPAMKKGVPPKQLAAQNKLVWIQKTAVGRRAKDIPPQILKLIFNEPAPGTDKKPVIHGKQLPDGSYVVIAMNALMDGVLTSITADQRLSLQKQMNNSFGTLDYGLYLAQQMSQAKIKMETLSP